MTFREENMGRVWLFQDNVDTDQILPGYAMDLPRDQLKVHVMAGSGRNDFSATVQKGDIIIAGVNFGCGSSREQAPVALKEAGVGVVIASSFARIFRRNAINIGLPVLVGDLYKIVKDNEIVNVNITDAVVTIVSTGNQIYCQPLSTNILETLSAGGLVEKVRKQLGNYGGGQ